MDMGTSEDVSSGWRDRAGIQAWYAREFAGLVGLGSWMLGGEPNTQDPAEFAGSELKLLIARLSTYRDVAPSITHGLLGELAQRVPGVFVDYAFLPPPKDLRILRDARVPLWTGTTTKAPPIDFHVLGISNSIAQELLNLPMLLHASGIPLWKDERMEREEVPIVLLGGNNSAATAIIHGDAEGGNRGGLVDAVIVGEVEELWPHFLSLVRAGRAAGKSKREILASCHGAIAGFYEPDRYRHEYARQDSGAMRLARIVADDGVEMPVRRAVVAKLDGVSMNERAPIPYDEDAAGRTQLPIDLGCPCFCNFCREGFEVGPYRERSPFAFLRGLEIAKREQGLHAVDFMSYNFNMHSRFYEILAGSLERMDSVWMKSQRFDILAEDPLMAGLQHAAGKASFTCGLEGISERLRRFLHKNLTREQILTASRGIFEAKARELKIFLIATGREQDEDLREWEQLVVDLVKLRSASPTRLLASLTPLLPMPNTPSQFLPGTPLPPEADAKVAAIGEICKRHGVEFRTAIEGDEGEVAQYLLRGDRRGTPALVEVALARGCIFYEGVPQGTAKALRQALERRGVDPVDLLAARSFEDCLPWDDINPGTGKDFVWKKHLESLKEIETEYCLDRLTVKGHCFRCDACTTPEQVLALVRRKIAPPPAIAAIQALRERRKNPLRVRLQVQVDRRWGATPLRFRAAAVARALLKAEEALVRPYLRPAAALDPLGGRGFVYGLGVQDFLFDPAVEWSALERAAAKSVEHSRDFRVLAVAPADTPAPEAERLVLRFTPWKRRDLNALRAAASALLKEGKVRHTEMRHEEGRRYESDGKNRFGLHELLVRGATFELVVQGSSELWPLLARLENKVAGEVEVLSVSLTRSLTGRYADVETADRDNV